MLDLDMSQTRGSAFAVAVGNSSQGVLAGSEKRIALIFFGPNTGRITLSPSNPVTLDQGPTVSGTFGVVELRYDVHGNIVKMPWFGIADAANRNLGVIEILSG